MLYAMVPDTAVLIAFEIDVETGVVPTRPCNDVMAVLLFAMDVFGETRAFLIVLPTEPATEAEAFRTFTELWTADTLLLRPAIAPDCEAKGAVALDTICSTTDSACGERAADDDVGRMYGVGVADIDTSKPVRSWLYSNWRTHKNSYLARRFFFALSNAANTLDIRSGWPWPAPTGTLAAGVTLPPMPATCLPPPTAFIGMLGAGAIIPGAAMNSTPPRQWIRLIS